MVLTSRCAGQTDQLGIAKDSCDMLKQSCASDKATHSSFTFMIDQDIAYVSKRRQAKPDLANSVLSFRQARALGVLSVVHAGKDGSVYAS